MSQPLVRLRGIERRFGSTRALSGADLDLYSGEVHGVLGGNGAGKSTLLNVLGGLLSPDSGGIEISGASVKLNSPRDAWSFGIGLVHQHFTLVPALSVRENLQLGLRGRSVHEAVMAVEAEMERTGLRVPLEANVSDLGVGDRQRTEILKALIRDPQVLVLDEPTAVLTPEEVDGLFALLRDLACEGRAVALVAHKLDEVLAVSDRLTVLRAGQTVMTAPRSQVSVRQLVVEMVGDGVADEIAMGVRAVPLSRAAVSGNRQVSGGAVVASLVGVHADGLKDVKLEVRAGEVQGIAGVEGNGQHELALVLSGRKSPSLGRADIPKEVAFIPQDRNVEGLVADFDLTENVALALSRMEEFRFSALMPWGVLRDEAERIRSRFEVTAPSTETRARFLSGGNQQRVIIGRELALNAPMLVAENPTRGLDVAAASYVHRELVQLASEGVAIVLISTDLDEVLGLADSVSVMTKGRIVEVPEAQKSREGVGSLMLGAEDVSS
ncbi:ATP-binding cassette domain-containing protein [Gemmatimonadales bacterium]|nr:ATP-binding cassette domain-containing protein [Gemmatimonadales bacterium]